jgi:hypothetical protein
MARTHYRIATAAAVGLSVVGVLAVLIAVIQVIVLLVNGPDPLTRAAGLNPFWATLVGFGSSVAVGLLLIVAGGVGRAIIALAAPKSAA